jgi:hypothetical protein
VRSLSDCAKRSAAGAKSGATSKARSAFSNAAARSPARATLGGH